MGAVSSADTPTPGGVAAGVEGATASRDDRAVGVLGKVTSTGAGSYSAAVRRINRGSYIYGIGVHGSHEGSGWGVFGTSAGGVGVYGLAPGGVGLVASGLTAAHFYGSVHTYGLLTADRFFVRGGAEVGGDLVVRGESTSGSTIRSIRNASTSCTRRSSRTRS